MKKLMLIFALSLLVGCATSKFAHLDKTPTHRTFTDVTVEQLQDLIVLQSLGWKNKYAVVEQSERILKMAHTVDVNSVQNIFLGNPYGTPPTYSVTFNFIELANGSVVVNTAVAMTTTNGFGAQNTQSIRSGDAANAAKNVLELIQKQLATGEPMSPPDSVAQKQEPICDYQIQGDSGTSLNCYN